MKVRGLISLMVVFLACAALSLNVNCGDDSSSSSDDGDKKPPGMALIPSGCFDMGDHFNEGNSNELPVHNVCITSDFYMDVHEVTNAEYKTCVDAGACTAPGSTASYTRTNYYGNQAYDDYPVLYVDWYQAVEYCSWAGKRLPTEAEWEYAARGGLSGKRYPWGDSISCTEANYSGCLGDTSAVGTYPPNGYGLYDMAGNVCEWVKDWFKSDYYSVSPTDDPPGPASGSSHSVRSGSWDGTTGNLRVSVRYQVGVPTSSQGKKLSFRCVKDAN